MFRTTPPPEGITVEEKALDFGSKRTNVFGLTPDSLYQTMPSAVTAIPYGLEAPPPGEAHSSTFFVVGEARPATGHVSPGARTR
jgi:hypothetical protein